MKCNICPRNCNADRNNGEIGACGVDSRIFVSRLSLHMWEEPSISGQEGSGTVFFAGCPLHCIYCQNVKISTIKSKIPEADAREYIDSVYDERTVNSIDDFHNTMKIYSIEGLAEALLLLQRKGANNINFVTPTHYSYEIIEVVKMARERGLKLPIVYNCSGYEKVETLKDLEGIVDIYLTDFKYSNEEVAKKYSYAKDYFQVAKLALKEMVRQQPQCIFDDRGIMTKGVIVRNLLLPLNVNNSKAVVKYVYETYGDSVYLSLMSQYTPMPQVENLSPLNRRVTKREYERLLSYVTDLGINNVYIQEGEVALESFIPDFLGNG